MDGTSLTPQEVKLHELKQLFPEVFAEGKVDWEKLKATLGEDINFSNERYVLNWAGKSDAFKVLQSTTSKTLIPAKDESVNFDETKNIFIEGENLEVLKVLQKSYFGKVKMIYIDPPYNTGNDSFIYPDKFSETKKDYEKRVGDKDEEGYMTKDGMFKKNSKENGQYHSNWMNMMYPRLFLAKNLLKQDGVIFVSIDDNEVHNLKMMMNEVFGEENFLGNIVRSTGQTTGQDSGGLGSSFDYILAYSKDDVSLSGLPLNEKDLKRFENEDDRGKFAFDQMRKTGSNDKRSDRPKLFYSILNPDGEELFPVAPAGYESCWRFEKKTFEKLKSDNYILWRKSKRDNEEIWWPYVKYYLEGRTKRPSPLWDDLDGNKKASRDLRALFDGRKIFDFPKPNQLIKRLIQIVPNSSNDDIVLDFFSGSGTTAHSLFELNYELKSKKKFICVQLPELSDESSEAYKAGYKNIAEISKERLRRASNKIINTITESEKKKKSEIPFEDEKVKIQLDLGFKVFKLTDSNFKQWQQIKNKDAKALEEQMKLFVDPVAKTATIENMVYELMLKSGKSLNSKIRNDKGFYAINDDELILLLEKAEKNIIDAIIKSKPKKVVALDKLFEDNDQLKTNTVLQMKDAGIEFKTI
jgi:adenine-specific DNA-methyltransferase